MFRERSSCMPMETPCRTILLTTPDGKPGLKADYSESMGRPGRAPNTAVLASRTETNVKLTDSNLPAEVAGKKSVGVHWTGFITPPETGDFLVGVRGVGFAMLTVDDKRVAMMFSGAEAGAGVGRVHLEKGQKAALSILYGSMDGQPRTELIWAKVNNAPSPEAIAAAKNADAVIAVVGIIQRA